MSPEKYAELLYDQLMGEDAWRDAPRAVKDAMVIWVKAESVSVWPGK